MKMKKILFFKRARQGNLNFKEKMENQPELLFLAFVFLIVITFFVLVLRLFQLTIVHGGYYSRLADQNRAREIIIEPQRGKILDRKGFVLVENSPPAPKITKGRFLSHRQYIDGPVFAPLIGYRQEANQQEIENDSCLNKLTSGDKVGKKGVERLFECALRGKRGKKLIEVNTQGKTLKTLSVIPPINGQTIQLAIDKLLQETAYQAIKNKKAAVVALKPKTGEVLVLASAPSFNPQDFEDNQSSIIKGYFEDKDQPFFNRALQGVYPPGSIFKLVVAAAALNEGKITAKTIFQDTGTIKAGPQTFGNWYFLQYGKKEGAVDIVKAIQRSNDIFFYKTGALVGPELIRDYSLRLGLENKTGLGLAEAEGRIPSPFWKKETLNQRWFLGDTYNLAIGQGYVLTTPIQIAQMTTFFANNGLLCHPKILKNGFSSPLIDDQYQRTNCQKIAISLNKLRLIREGMKKACATGGTGWPFFNFKANVSGQGEQPVSVGCKTGTAESHHKNSLPYAWFTVFAPFDNPQIVVTVLVEEGGEGSNVAAPIAKKIIKAYLERKE